MAENPFGGTLLYTQRDTRHWRALLLLLLVKGGKNNTENIKTHI